MKSILFPTDFSEVAYNAQKLAFQIAKKIKASITILHSLNTAQQFVNLSLTSPSDPILTGVDSNLVLSAIQKQNEVASEKLRLIVEEGRAEGIEIDFKLSHNELNQDIETFLQKEDAPDLIVMGTHGASGFKEAFLGSNAQKVVRTSSVPVLCVNEAVADFDLKSFVFASDFLEDNINQLIPSFYHFASLFNAEVKLVYINCPAYFEDSLSTIHRIEKVAAKYNFSINDLTVFNDHTIEDGIIRFAKHCNADMIGLATHGYRGFKNLINDNITETVVNHSKIPVLSMRC